MPLSLHVWELLSRVKLRRTLVDWRIIRTWMFIKARNKASGGQRRALSLICQFWTGGSCCWSMISCSRYHALVRNPSFTKAVPLFTNTRRPMSLTSTRNNPMFLAALPANIKEEWAASGPYLTTKYKYPLASETWRKFGVKVVYMGLTYLWLQTLRFQLWIPVVWSGWGWKRWVQQRLRDCLFDLEVELLSPIG